MFFSFLKNGIITVNYIINKELINKFELNDIPFSYFFYPEIENLFGTQELKKLNKVDPPNNNYMMCLIESIKCHHNDIAEYVKNNLLLIDNEKENEDICLQFHNYLYFQADFFYLNLYHYDKLVYILLKKNKGEIDFKIII